MDRERLLEELWLEEELARKACRNSFLSYCQHPDLVPGEAPGKHHQYMISALELVEQGEIKRLMVLMPQGTASRCTARSDSHRGI